MSQETSKKEERAASDAEKKESSSLESFEEISSAEIDKICPFPSEGWPVTEIIKHGLTYQGQLLV